MNRSRKSKPPVATPKQARSAATQERILEAAEKRLIEGTFDQASVQDMVSEAGCSVGAFYGRFANKAAVVYHFYDARCGELEALVDEILDPDRPDTLELLLTEFTQMIVKRTFAYAAVIRSDALRNATDPDDPITLRAQKLNVQLLSSLRHCLAVREAETSHAIGQENALIVLALVGGLPRDAVISGLRLVDDPGKLDADRFAQELTLLVTRYLGVHTNSE